MTKRDLNDMDKLDAALHLAASTPPELPPGLMARVLADADTMQVVQEVELPRRRFWASVRSSLGGWQGVGGLVAATCTGFWFGISPPDMLPNADDVIWGVLGTSPLDVAAQTEAFGWELEEG